MTAFWSVTSTPVGPYTAIVDAEGAVLASGWTTDADELRGLIHRSLRPAAIVERSDLGSVSMAVESYHKGDLTSIDSIVVRQHSGEFVLQAWEVLRTVPAGAPVTYTEFASKAGRPAAVRGAAAACSRNAAALFVPCHRVLRIGGSLGGFRWGLPVKRWLLEHER